MGDDVFTMEDLMHFIAPVPLEQRSMAAMQNAHNTRVTRPPPRSPPKSPPKKKKKKRSKPKSPKRRKYPVLASVRR